MDCSTISANISYKKEMRRKLSKIGHVIIVYKIKNTPQNNSFWGVVFCVKFKVGKKWRSLQ